MNVLFTKTNHIKKGDIVLYNNKFWIVKKVGRSMIHNHLFVDILNYNDCEVDFGYDTERLFLTENPNIMVLRVKK